jgi:hypothetical protein
MIIKLMLLKILMGLVELEIQNKNLLSYGLFTKLSEILIILKIKMEDIYLGTEQDS